MKPLAFNLSCPVPITEYPNVLLAHGGGGRLMASLIEKMFLTAFKNSLPHGQHDSAVFELKGKKAAFTTDSFVVSPLFFPGGDIGRLAVFGTVNDLAMSGARPRYLSAGFIIEEGLPMESLWKVVCSMAEAAREAGVEIVTGDTKVVEKGKGDGIYINTSGVGVVEHDFLIHPSQIQPGDRLIINGDLGRHGMAIMALREGLEFKSTIQSDCAPLNGLVQDLLEGGVRPRCLRDLTRGGLASALNEMAQQSGVDMEIEESAVPVREDVRGACEILGLDPFYVANEGRLVAFVEAGQAELALAIMKKNKEGDGARLIGKVGEEKRGLVTVKSVIGPKRILDMLSGEQLPRIC